MEELNTDDKIVWGGGGAEPKEAREIKLTYNTWRKATYNPFNWR